MEVFKIKNRKVEIVEPLPFYLEKNSNGEVELIDSETFNNLLIKNQNIIIAIDPNYFQNFVIISNYINSKKNNTQKLFSIIHKVENEKELYEYTGLLKKQIHTYELIVFHSISMISSLLISDLKIFNEIYESFDNSGIFNSKWENEVSNKLTNIGNRLWLWDLMYSIDKMEEGIVNSLYKLTYTTKKSFSKLNSLITSQLSNIDSPINYNNLIIGIQTYRIYKINQHT
jgi:hypothetical protein